jgi:hypothetical protein
MLCLKQRCIPTHAYTTLAPAKHTHTRTQTQRHRTRKGHLTRADLAEGLRIASPSAFDALHRSGSLESELEQEFAAMDANGDGVISLDEYTAALSRHAPVSAH